MTKIQQQSFCVYVWMMKNRPNCTKLYMHFVCGNLLALYLIKMASNQPKTNQRKTMFATQICLYKKKSGEISSNKSKSRLHLDHD